jgi:hypothetical protein
LDFVVAVADGVIDRLLVNILRVAAAICARKKVRRDGSDGRASELDR